MRLQVTLVFVSLLLVVAALVAVVGHSRRSTSPHPTGLASILEKQRGNVRGVESVASLSRPPLLTNKRQEESTAVQIKPQFQFTGTKLVADGQKLPFVIDPDRTKKLPWMPSHLGKTEGRVELGMVDGATGVVQHRIAYSVVSPTMPRALRLENMVTEDEARQVIAMANKELQRSQVISHNFAKPGSEIHQVRTSFGMFLASVEQRSHPANRAVRERVRHLVGLQSDDWIEATQVLRYDSGQFYRPHSDYFDAHDSANMNRGGQRIATVIVWLNHVEKGGTTTFPHAKLTVQPQMGGGVLFYDADEDMKVDMYSEHGGDPPGPGSQKWVMVFWCHPRTFI